VLEFSGHGCVLGSRHAVGLMVPGGAVSVALQMLCVAGFWAWLCEAGAL